MNVIHYMYITAHVHAYAYYYYCIVPAVRTLFLIYTCIHSFSVCTMAS